MGACPHCGGAVHERAIRYACDNLMGADATCKFAVKKLWCEREIARDDIGQLMATGRTEHLEGFRGWSGQPFKALLEVGPERNVDFDFRDTKRARA